ncbi:MAG TPA: FlgD immunoglobulin-like domain containing protein [Thermoleophilia bacterium]|nr:FlgD immunoglobulin-like domain containing protein [Thermoleophilia bacterium]
MRAPSAISGRARRLAVVIIVTGLALGALWSLPRVSTATAAWLTAPPVRAKTVTPGEALLVTRTADTAGDVAEETAGEIAAETAGDVGADAVAERRRDPAAAPDVAAGAPPAGAAVRRIDAGMRYEMVGLLCDDVAGVDALTVHFRASADGRAWGEWVAAPVERVAEQGDEAPRAFTDPVWLGEARFVQVAVTSADGSRRRVPRPRLVFLNTTGDATLAVTLTNAARSVACTLGGLQAAPEAQAMTTKPAIVLRSQWGANEDWRTGSPSFAPLKMAFVHHTAGSNSYSPSDAPAIVRGIYYYHTHALDWSDIGYNFLIDRYGVIYEGRYGGITNAAIGAQTYGFNTSSTGVSVLGSFGTVPPPSAAMTSLKRLLAWKLDVHHINPLAKAEMVCYATQKYTEGSTVTFNVISGHRNANYTACPGDAFYALLPAVRKAVGGMGLPKIYNVKVSRTVISPNGDDFRDALTLSFVGSEVLDWTLQVKAADGTVVRTKTGRGQYVSTEWAGLSDDGRVVPDGPYRMVVSGTSPLGTARSATAEVVVDTAAPVPVECVMGSPFFSPNGDAYIDNARLKFTCAEPTVMRVSVLDEADAFLLKLVGWKSIGTKRVIVPWDGRIPVDDVLRRAPEGTYKVKLEVRDPAGNTGVTVLPVRLDLTAGFLTPAPPAFSPNGDGVKDETLLGFTLTRPATTRAVILLDGAAVRTLELGELAAGVHGVTWEGLDDAGLALASGVYRARVEVESALGASTVAKNVTLDRTKPRITAPLTVSVTLGSTARMRYSVTDRWSPTAKVTVTIKRASDGVVVKKLYLGWVTTGVTHVAAWKPPARRKYIATFRAVDQAGNRQYELKRCVIKVL